MFVALTPTPSPTAWERGVGAHGGAPCADLFGALKRQLQRLAEAALPHPIIPFTPANPAGAPSAAAPKTRGRPLRSWAGFDQAAAGTRTAPCRAARR
jgi:hypothetical protein